MKPSFKEFLMLTIAAFLMVATHTVEAETIIYLHTATYHEDRESDYNERNWGLGFRHYTDDGFYKSAGTYKNSEHSQSYYGGVGWEWSVGETKLSVDVGLVTGYIEYDAAPYVVPSIRYKDVRLMYLAYPKAALHLSVDILKF